jgi:hypothetical protein
MRFEAGGAPVAIKQTAMNRLTKLGTFLYISEAAD